MAARQLWCFLSPLDVPWLVERIAAREPGLVASEGRYLRGDPRELLADPARLERREALPHERRLYLFHPKHSQELFAHEQPAGPFRGWSQIDEERSDCLVLRVPSPRLDQGAPPRDDARPAGAPGAPEPPARESVDPARLYAHTSFWRGGDKLRKRPPFALWANQTLRALLGELPATSVRFMRAGPDAKSRAERGELRLTYLFRDIDPRAADASLGPQPLPDGAITDETPDDPAE